MHFLQNRNRFGHSMGKYTTDTDLESTKLRYFVPGAEKSVATRRYPCLALSLFISLFSALQISNANKMQITV